jgi:hypothetical protein
LARIDGAARNVADLARKLNHGDSAIEETAKRGKASTRLSAKARTDLAGRRKREASLQN